jgi:hypothetical protein
MLLYTIHYDTHDSFRGFYSVESQLLFLSRWSGSGILFSNSQSRELPIKNARNSVSRYGLEDVQNIRVGSSLFGIPKHHSKMPSTTIGDVNGHTLTTGRTGNVPPKRMHRIPQPSTKLAEQRWQLEQMAGAFRVFAKLGFADGSSGHISMRGKLGSPRSKRDSWES